MTKKLFRTVDVDLQLFNNNGATISSFNQIWPAADNAAINELFQNNGTHCIQAFNTYYRNQ